MEYYIIKLKHKNHKNFIEFLIILQSDKTMSQIEESTKELFINVKDLSFKSDQLVVDLMRYLTEALPQLQITRNGMELDVIAPFKLSKRVVKLRLKKYLHKKGVSGEYRPIAMNDLNKDGYVIKEKKILELSYY